MKTAIIISKYQADQNIKQFLTDLPENITVHEFDEKCVDLERIDEEIDADLFVFATLHRSKDEKPCLTCHPPGNWGGANYGGEGKKLNVVPAAYFKAFYLKLKEKSPIDVAVEATHHGPLLKKPTLFVEIGSTEKQWTDETLGKVMADCIKEVFAKEENVEESFFIVGGTHYNSVAMKILERTPHGVGHVCPKHNLEKLDETMIRQAMEQCEPKSSCAVLDWKGMGSEKQALKKLLEEANIPWKKARSVYK